MDKEGGVELSVVSGAADGEDMKPVSKNIAVKGM